MVYPVLYLLIVLTNPLLKARQGVSSPTTSLLDLNYYEEIAFYLLSAF